MKIPEMTIQEKEFCSIDSPASSVEIRHYMTMRALTCDVSDSLYNAAEKMIKNNVGSVVVTKNGDVAGILTKGDILNCCILSGGNLKDMAAEAVMSKPVVCILPNKSLEEAARLMSERNVSKLRVIDESGLLSGIITSTDIIRIEPGYVKFLKDLIESKRSRDT